MKTHQHQMQDECPVGYSQWEGCFSVAGSKTQPKQGPQSRPAIAHRRKVTHLDFKPSEDPVLGTPGLGEMWHSRSCLPTSFICEN